MSRRARLNLTSAPDRQSTLAAIQRLVAVKEMPKNLSELLGRLIAERGGMGAFTVKQYMIVRGLVYALVRISNGDHCDLSEIAAMEAQLPPLQEPKPLWDLSLLTDDEMYEYERLMNKARGLGPPDPLPPPPNASELPPTNLRSSVSAIDRQATNRPASAG